MINKVTLNGVEVPGIIRDTFHYRAQCGASGPYRVGGVYGSYIEFDYFTPSEVTISLGDVLKYSQVVDISKSLAPSTARTIPVNDFTVKEVRVSNKSTHIVAYDSVIKLNTDFSKRLKALESSFPMSLLDLVSEAATVANVYTDIITILQTWMHNIEFNYFYVDGITCRDIFSYATEILGRLAYCPRGANSISTTPFWEQTSTYWNATSSYIIAPDDADYSSGSHYKYNVWYKENSLEKFGRPAQYDGAKIVGSNGQTLGVYNDVTTPTKIYYITGNLLIDNISYFPGGRTYDDLAEEIWNGVTGTFDAQFLHFEPTRVKLFPFCCPFYAGQFAAVVDTSGNKHTIPIMSFDFSESEVVIEGFGRDDAETGYGTNYSTADEDQTLLTSQINSLFSIVEELAQRRITELWSNSNTTSSFSAQTVLLSESMSDFDYLLISYAFSTSSQDFSTQLIPVSEIYDDAREFSLRINAATYNRTGARNLTATSDTEIKFLAASYNTNTANGYVIPANIYGIKL